LTPTLANRTFIGRFAEGANGQSALPWKPSTEADVDNPDTLDTPLARHPPDPARTTQPASEARWRQRTAAAESREHVELPLEPAGAPPQRPLRDDELWRLARRAHGAALHVDLELRTTLVRQVLRRDFVYVSRLLHALEASRRVQGLEHARLPDALAALQRRADAVQAMLDRMRADLDARVAARGHADAQITFARPTRFQATVVSPTAHRYLALLVHADSTLAQLERAWLLGVVDPATRSALSGDCRRALHGYKDLVGDRRTAVGEHVREVNARRSQVGKSDRDR